ncbi:hypothetical protein Tco_0421072 [Tanacetum coccineum]
MSNSNTNLQTQSSNALHNAFIEAGSKDRPPMLAPVPVAEGSSETTTERYMENYKNVSQDIRDQLNAEAEAVHIILTGIDNNIYSTVDACPNACEMCIAIERLKQGESINVQDLETKLYWEFGKFTSRDGELLESYYSWFYKMMNELVRNQCHVTNHQVNVQFLLQLQPEWQRFVTLVKQSQELKTVSYHKLYDILKQHQNEVNEIRTKRLARTANPLALVAQQQPVYHHQNHPTQNTQYSSTRSQQSTRNRGKAIVTSSAPTYDPEPATVTEDEEMSKEKEIDKLMALISLSFKKISNYKQQPSLYFINTESKLIRCFSTESTKELGLITVAVNVVGLGKITFFVMATTSRGYTDRLTIWTNFGDEPMHKVQNNNDNYNVFAMENEHPKQPESSNDIYLAEHGDTNITIDSLDICYDSVQDDQDETDDLDQERDLLASLIQKLKCEIDDSKNRNKFLESSNKALVDKLKGCYNDNLALMLAPDSDEMIRLEKERRSKLSDLIRPFDYDQLNNLYDLFVPQREKSVEQHYFPKTSKMSHTSSNKEFSKESFRKQTTLLEKRMDESIPWDQKCKISKELFKIKKSVDTIFDEGMLQNKQSPKEHILEMVADLRYFNSLEHEVDTLKSQLETQKTQFLNEIDRLSREYYYADHMNAILGVYTDLDEVTNLQCDYLETVEKCEHLEKEL